MKKMKRFLSLVLSLTMALTIVACGNKSVSPSSVPTATSDNVATSPSAPETIEKLVVALPSWPTNLDPVTQMGNQNTRWLNQVYDTLLYCENDGSLSSYICEDWKMIDELTAEFKLKSGITFHNGDPLTANDIKFSYDRVLFDNTGYVNGNIPGVVNTITNVEVVDELTVRMSTSDPDPILFNRVAAQMGV